MNDLGDKCELRYIVGGFAEVDAGWSRGDHVANYHRLYSIRSGEAVFRYDGVECILEPNWIYLFPCGKTASYSCEQEMSLDWVHFDARIYNFNLFDYFSCPQKTAVTKLTNPLFERMHELKNDSLKEAEYELPAILQQLLSAFLCRKVLKNQSQGLQRMAPVFSYIEKNLHSSPRVAELADILNLEQNYFADLFSKIVGTPPGKYVQERRIEAVCQLLTTDMSLREISDQLGYYDNAYFCRFFKNSTGMTPTGYRMNQVKLRAASSPL